MREPLGTWLNRQGGREINLLQLVKKANDIALHKYKRRGKDKRGKGGAGKGVGNVAAMVTQPTSSSGGQGNRKIVEQQAAGS